MELHEKKCVPCEGGAQPLTRAEAEKLLSQVQGWVLSDDVKNISRTFEFKNFVQAMAFVDNVADAAEIDAHHPDIHIFYNKVTLELSTHAIDGLSENDFIAAAKINRIR